MHPGEKMPPKIDLFVNIFFNESIWGMAVKILVQIMSMYDQWLVYQLIPVAQAYLWFILQICRADRSHKFSEERADNLA